MSSIIFWIKEAAGFSHTLFGVLLSKWGALYLAPQAPPEVTWKEDKRKIREGSLGRHLHRFHSPVISLAQINYQRGDHDHLPDLCIGENCSRGCFAIKHQGDP